MQSLNNSEAVPLLGAWDGIFLEPADFFKLGLRFTPATIKMSLPF